MKLRVSNLLPILLMLFLAALTLWLRIASEGPAGRGRGHERHDPDAIVDNFKVTRLDEKGAPQYRISARRMVHFADDDSTELTEPSLLRSGVGPPVTITARRGTLTRDVQEAFFHDEVLVVRAATAEREELRVQTDYLHILPEINVARTDRLVTITQGRSVVTGVGMELDENARRFKILSKARGTFERDRK